MKRKVRGRNKGGEKELITDDRFAAAQSDPRFTGPALKRSKVEIDSRFSGVFSDAKFGSSKTSVDKRGKPKSKKETDASLSHYYRLQNKEKVTKLLPFDEKDDQRSRKAVSESNSEEEDDKLDETSDSDEEEQVSGSSLDSSSTELSEDDDYSNEGEDDLFMPQEDNVPEIDKETKRLAVVNLDWGQVRAVDIYVLLSSFLPKGGEIQSVSIYPSDFGIQRMKEEELHGPVSFFDNDDSDDDEQADEVKLRAYELSRLRYYYAVVECDSIATADYIYKTCDGVEFERSANKLDLRFIQDSMTFEHEPRDVAKEAPANYEGVDFQTRALQHSKVDLTWDDDELQRKKTFKKKLNEKQLAELELKEYLASDGSETDDDDSDGNHNKSSQKHDKKREKYRALLESGDGSDDDHQEKDQDLEVTFNFGLDDISKRISEKKERESETVWEAYLRKKKEKKKAKAMNRSKNHSEDDSDAEEEVPKQSDDFFIEEPSDNDAKKANTKRKNSDKQLQKGEAEASVAELELLTADDNALDTHVKGYNLKAKKSKGKKGKTITDEEKIPSVDYDDPRFSSLFTSPHFALDPTDPQFKRSAAYARQLTKKNSEKDRSGADRHETSPSSNHKKASIPTGSSIPSIGEEKDDIAASVKSLKMRLKQLASAPKAKAVGKSKHF